MSIPHAEIHERMRRMSAGPHPEPRPLTVEQELRVAELLADPSQPWPVVVEYGEHTHELRWKPGRSPLERWEAGEDSMLAPFVDLPFSNEADNMEVIPLARPQPWRRERLVWPWEL